MTNKIHVPIDGIENITGTSQGHVKTGWKPADGYARERSIQEARLQAMEDYQVQKAEQNAVFDTQRFLMMEMAIADLQKRLSAVEGK